MIDFLGLEAAALITKVNRNKFTIKAETCINGLSCLTKVRIYKLAVGEYTVEMQRRTGDSIAFQQLYQKASAYLQAPLSCGNAGDAVASSSMSARCGGSEVSVAPLLDLATSGCMELEAEAAQALEQAAVDANVLVQLCTPHAFIAFRNLLQLACFSIADPLARILQCLATLPEAREGLADEELLRAMIESIGAPTTGHQGSERLAQAVHSSIGQHWESSSYLASGAVMCALAEKSSEYSCALLGASASDASTARYLEDSLQTLREMTHSQNAMACY